MHRKSSVLCSDISANILPVSAIRFSGELPSLRIASSFQKSATRGHRSDPVWSATKEPAKSGISIRPKKSEIYLLNPFAVVVVRLMGI